MRIYGIHPVVEALRARRVTALRVSFRADDRLNDVVRLAEQQGIPVRRAKVDELDRFAKGGTHQGVVADVHDAVHLSVEDLVTGAKGAPLIVVPLLLATFRACIHSGAVGSWATSRRFHPSPTTSPEASTTRAPTGTSPASAARSARSRARAIHATYRGSGGRGTR